MSGEVPLQIDQSTRKLVFKGNFGRFDGNLMDQQMCNMYFQLF